MVVTHEKTNGEMEERKEKEKILVWEKERNRMMMMKTRHDRTYRRPQGNEEIEKREVLFTKLRGVCHHPVLVVSLVYHLRRGGNCPRMSIECPVRDRTATLSQ